MSKQRGADVRTTTVPKGGPGKKRIRFERFLMHRVPMPGEAFAGKYRTARIDRFQARAMTSRARAQKRVRRHLTHVSQRGNHR